MPIPAAPSTPPLISGERVFVSSLPGLVSAHDIKDGRELWRDTVNPDQPIVGDGERVFIAGNESVQALQVSDRSVAWRTSTGTVTAPLVVKEGWVIVASAVRMLALRATDGSIVWQREHTLQRDRGTIDGNTLFAPLANGRLQAIDLANGATRWERAFGGVPAEPLVVGDRLYVGTSDKHFYCLKTSTGEEDWKFHVGASMRGRAATDGKRVFFVALDNLVRALSRGSGSLQLATGSAFSPVRGARGCWRVGVRRGPDDRGTRASCRDRKRSGQDFLPGATGHCPGDRYRGR